jgi:hypothetical protein
MAGRAFASAFGLAVVIGAGVMGTPSATRAAEAAPPPVVLVTAPSALVALERGAGDFGARVVGRALGPTHALASDPLYRDWVESLRSDLEARRRRDPASGVGMRFAHRLFDASWLDSPLTRFELVGVVNRVDRRPFRPDRCGETRLVYRLAYSTTRRGRVITSRLPMTVNVVYFQPDDGDGCRGVARRWAPAKPLEGEALASFLASEEGPLAPARLATVNLKAVEINLQQVRWPSTVRPDMAGYAEYLLRVFHLDPKRRRLFPAPLENTPDVGRLKRDPRAAAALLAWARDPKNLGAIDAGTAIIPEELSATSAVSVSPRGLGRLANRPFAQLLTASALADLPLAGTKTVRSPAAFLRRLDGSSCAGCHQMRSVAGFHLLGEERDAQKEVDALWLPGSPHLDAELARRAAYVSALVAGRPPDERRPLPDRDRFAGAYGAHCGLGDAGFRDWTCSAGLVCTASDDEVGSCLPPGPPRAGDPCEKGELVASADPLRDRVLDRGYSECERNGGCFTNRGGFPGGMCAISCGAARAEEACGLIPILKDFNGCVARGQPFDTCILENADPAAMRACDVDHPCRDDFICARSRSKRGVCIPPYFLFQLRVDGHVL